MLMVLIRRVVQKRRFIQKDAFIPARGGDHLSRGFCQPSCSYFLRAESFIILRPWAEGMRPSIQERTAFLIPMVSFLSFIQSFQDIGLFLLDEPEAALSPQRQLTADTAVAMAWRLTVLITTNSPILLGIPNAVLSFDDGIIEEITYEQTASYRITEMFINNREYITNKLLPENEK